MTNRFRSIAVAAACLAVAIATAPAGALDDIEPAAPVQPEQDGLQTEAEARKREREAELEAIRQSIEVSRQRQAALRQDIEGMETDRARLNADLIATAQRLQSVELDIARVETRLEELQANEDGVRTSLRARRSALAEILMALQRMGRTPPPVLLARPEDALELIRGSVLAGAVLPEIRIEAEALAADLAELAVLSGRIEAERNTLRSQYTVLGEERARIDLLMERRKTERQQTELALGAEQRKASELAAQASSVEALIRSLEAETAAAAKAAAEAREAAAVAPPPDRDEAARRLADTSRIAPAVRFEDAKGLLTWPVPGAAVLRYGDPDGLGGKSQGLSLATRAGSPVVSPADGWVVYAGPFRSYGQLLILNAGDGYHVVLAGMERIDAALGQFVLAGEPVARMGATRLASLGDIEHTSAQPTLYVEFRKDGTAINSSPWWPPEDTDEDNG